MNAPRNAGSRWGLLIVPMLWMFIAWDIPPSWAAPKQVHVQIPPFPVELNGVSIDHQHSTYPLLMYNNVVYFPMSWNFSRAMSLRPEWSEMAGFSLLRDNQFREKLVQDLNGSHKPGQVYSAAVAQEPITVNWKRLDNNREAYPILRFRDILYFPMTWRFTHDEFEWTTEWDSEKGLRLTTVQHKVFYDLFYDEGDRLYASANDTVVYSIDKGMKQTPVRLTREEAESIKKKAKEREQPHKLTISAVKKVEYREGRFYYGAVELLSLDRIARLCSSGAACTASINANPPDFEEAIVTMNEQLTLVYLYVELWPSEPGKRGLYRPVSFLIKDGKAQLLEQITQFPDRMIRNPDGSLWFYSLAPEDTRDARTQKAQVWLIRPDGMVEELNSRLQAANVEVLKVKDGRMVVRSNNHLFGMSEPKPSDGVYELDTQLDALKRYEHLVGDVYVDEAGSVFYLNGLRNELTDLTTGSSQFWYDYELVQQLY